MPFRKHNYHGRLNAWRFKEEPPNHCCNWPDCNVSVPWRFWGCKHHWDAMPENYREWIARTWVKNSAVQTDDYRRSVEALRVWIEARVTRTRAQMGLDD